MAKAIATKDEIVLRLTPSEAEFLRTILGAVYPAYSTGYERDPFQVLDKILYLNRKFLGSKKLNIKQVAVCSEWVAQILTADREDGPTKYIGSLLQAAGHEPTGY